MISLGVVQIHIKMESVMEYGVVGMMDNYGLKKIMLMGDYVDYTVGGMNIDKHTSNIYIDEHWYG
jgi:hypothetical protein